VAEGLTSLDEINCLAYTGVAASDSSNAEVTEQEVAI
jgi:hypothetical protein